MQRWYLFIHSLITLQLDLTRVQHRQVKLQCPEHKKYLTLLVGKVTFYYDLLNFQNIR